MQVLDALCELGMTRTLTPEVLRGLARSVAAGSGDAAARRQTAAMLLRQLDDTAEAGGHWG